MEASGTHKEIKTMGEAEAEAENEDENVLQEVYFFLHRFNFDPIYFVE